jgi:hypothetical protein
MGRSFVLCLVDAPAWTHEFCDTRGVRSFPRVSRCRLTEPMFEAGAWDRGVALLLKSGGRDVVMSKLI